jgi:hypothetical protein
MTVIWSEGREGWSILQPSGFPNEARLHELIAEAPQVLPLAGNPDLVVLGTEVPLGSGRADIVAVETTGRPVVIEVKLANNPEARRAVVAQILAYASNLYRNSPEQLTAALGQSLAKRGHSSIVESVQEADQGGSMDPVAFASALEQNMETGDIRLVLVLDSAPSELIGVVGYLEAIAPNLTMDLITVTAFQVGDQRVIVPQRIEPARVEAPSAPVKSSTPGAGTGITYSPGSTEFAAGIDSSSPEHQQELRRYQEWADGLAEAGLATLRTGRGQGRWTLAPIVKGGDAGLVTVWNDGGPYISAWRSAFAKWSPNTLAALDSVDPPVLIAQGNSLRNVPDDVLGLFASAYEEAAGSGLALPELDTKTPAILIKLGPWHRGTDLETGRSGHGYRDDMTRDELYESVRAWWVLDPKRAETFNYVVAVHAGVTRAVWEVVPGSWKPRTREGETVRWSFEGVDAPSDIVQEFVGERGKRVPKFRHGSDKNVFGQANPIGYWP